MLGMTRSRSFHIAAETRCEMSKNKQALMVVGSAAMLLCSRPSRGQSIGVFFDPNATTCSTYVGDGDHGFIYIIASLNGAAAGGITGVECRVDFHPANLWAVTCSFPEYFPGCNDYLTGDGARVVWPSCQHGSGGILVLARFFYIAFGSTPTTYLTV